MQIIKFINKLMVKNNDGNWKMCLKFNFMFYYHIVPNILFLNYLQSCLKYL